MRRISTIGIILFLSALLIIPFVFGFVFMYGSNLPLFSNGGYSPMGDGTTSVFVTPSAVIKDYALQPVGSKFTVYMDISGVADLFTWQVNLTWNKAILNVNSGVGKLFNMVEGDFLLQTTSPSKTAAFQLGYVVNLTDNTKGSAVIGNSVLNSGSSSYPGISGSGSLVSIEFLVVGYGATPLTLSLTGNFKTSLLDSTGATMAFTSVNGYFDNRIPGDISGPESPPGSGLYPYDGAVNTYDLAYLGKKFGTSDAVADFTGPENPPGSGTYPPDGVVNTYDLAVLGKNFGRNV